MLAMSVPVVRKRLDAVAGSAPTRFRIKGTMTPKIPLSMQALIIAVTITKASNGACGLCACHADHHIAAPATRSEEHTSELQSLMRISYAVFCLKKKNHTTHENKNLQGESNGNT